VANTRRSQYVNTSHHEDLNCKVCIERYKALNPVSSDSKERHHLMGGHCVLWVSGFNRVVRWRCFNVLAYFALTILIVGVRLKDEVDWYVCRCVSGEGCSSVSVWWGHVVDPLSSDIRPSCIYILGSDFTEKCRRG